MHNFRSSYSRHTPSSAGSRLSDSPRIVEFQISRFEFRIFAMFSFQLFLQTTFLLAGVSAALCQTEITGLGASAPSCGRRFDRIERDEKLNEMTAKWSPREQKAGCRIFYVSQDAERRRSTLGHRHP